MTGLAIFLTGCGDSRPGIGKLGAVEGFAGGIAATEPHAAVAGQDVLDTADFYRKLWRLGNAGVKVKLIVLQGSEINRISLKSSDRYLHYRNPRLR